MIIGHTNPRTAYADGTDGYQVFDRIAVKLVLEDDDNLLTPADKAELNLFIKNISSKKIKAVRTHFEVEKELKDNGVLKILTKPDTWWTNEEIAPGEVRQFAKSAKIEIACERNRWIYKHLIEGTPGMRTDEQKPIPELGIKDMFRLKLHVSYAHREFEEGYNNLISVTEKDTGKVVRLAYPDLSTLVGQPAGSRSELEYYRKGDPKWTFPGHALIRAVALRAARYGGHEDGVLDKLATPHPEKQLVSPEDPLNWEGMTNADDKKNFLFPEKDPDKIVKNTVDFVHQELMPKGCPKTPISTKGLATRIWQGWWGPKVDFFICQEHSFLLGSLLRALGLCAREINVITYHAPIKRVPLWFSCVEQDAASEIFYDNKWHFFGLFTLEENEKPFTSHVKHYGEYLNAYEMWAGVERFEGNIPRFRLKASASSIDMYKSMAWKYMGWGTRLGFEETEHPPYGESTFGTVSNPYLIYWWNSPVISMIEMAGGKRIGASAAVDPTEFRKFLYNSAKKPANMVAEIPGAYYFPEDFKFYPDASDAASATLTKQTIFVPAGSASDRSGHTIRMVGTGNGHFSIECAYFSKEGDFEIIGKYQGEISEGERFEISGSDLRMPSAAVPAGMTGPGDSGQDKLRGQPTDKAPPGIKKPVESDGYDTVLDF